MSPRGTTIRRSGRRPGKQDTRETILASARAAFAERGYDGASIRHIASKAGVDPSLVHHYFGTKEALFRSVMAVPFDPEMMIERIFGEGGDDVSEPIVRTFLTIWGGPVSGTAMRGLLRSAVAHERTAKLMREFFTTQILRHVFSRLPNVDPEEVPLRASLVATQLFGIAVIRYILKFEPLAAEDDEAVIAAVTPTVRRYLYDDLGGTSTVSH